MLDNIALGIERLARFAPGNWLAKINLDTLNMGHARDCVLGQIFGDYTAGTQKLGVSWSYLENDVLKQPPVKHGFMPATPASSAELTSAWKQAIQERRNACSKS